MNKDVLARNNVNVFGKGQQPMLFAHGFGCDQNMWRFITHAFENDYKIVLFDYVGSGQSDVKAYNPERYSNLNGYAMDVLEVCDALQLKDVVLVHRIEQLLDIFSFKAAHVSLIVDVTRRRSDRAYQ